MAFGEPGDEARNQVGYLIVRLKGEQLISIEEARAAIAKIYPEFDLDVEDADPAKPGAVVPV